MMHDNPKNVGRMMKQPVLHPAVEVDCSTWGIAPPSKPRTTGRFVKPATVHEAVEVDCSGWGEELRVWQQLQALVKQLEQRYHAEPTEADTEQVTGQARMVAVLGIVASTFADQALRHFLCNLLITAVHGNRQELARILGNLDDDMVARQVERYAATIVTQRSLGRTKAQGPQGQKTVGEMNGAESEQSGPINEHKQ